MTYYQLEDTADFLDLLCKFDLSYIESADSVLGHCANVEVIVTLDIFWFDSAWSFATGEGQRTFVLHTPRRARTGGLYQIILTDTEEG